MGKLKKGRDILADQVTSEKGVSDVGIEIRRADQKNPGVVSHGYARVSSPQHHNEKAKNYLKSIVSALKVQPKPNLTRSELESFDSKLQKDDHWGKRIKEMRAQKESARMQKLTDHFKAKGQEVPEHLKNPQPVHLDYNKIRQEAKNINKKPAVAAVKPAAPAPTPVDSPAPTQSRYGKLHDPDWSGTVDYAKQKKLASSEKEKAKIIPADVSEPAIIENRTSVSEPAIINGPNQLNSYKGDNMKKCGDALRKMVGCLQKVDPKTKLPGIMMDKSADTKKNVNVSPSLMMTKSQLESDGALIKRCWEGYKATPGKKAYEKGSCEPVEKATPAAAPAPAPAKPAAPKMQQPKMKPAKPQMPKQKMPEMQMSADMKKDDKPHPAGSPEERSHAVAEGQVSLPQALADVKGSDAKKRFFDHLKTLKDKSKHRSEGNIK